MSEAKTKRTRKKQLGQFMTPIDLCKKVIDDLEFTKDIKILEPSFGCGNFIISIIEKLLLLYDGSLEEKLDAILANNLYGVEYDKQMHDQCLENIKTKWGYLPAKHNLVLSDYFLYESEHLFDYILGNPPFGGTLNPVYQDKWDKKWGWRCDEKIKKETYSFFMVKSVELLKPNGVLKFISSDTFLTIKTMKGLRKFLLEQGLNEIQSIENFSDETKYPMVILTHERGVSEKFVSLNGTIIPKENMEKTDNFSWNIDSEYTPYFSGDKLSKFLIASSGMTVGKNELFLKDIDKENSIIEEYDYAFFDDPITLEKEYEKARNGIISTSKIKKIEALEKSGAVKRNVSINRKTIAAAIKLPHPNYKLYNKAASEILYAKPNTAIYWKDDGDAVITFKKNGPWYLHGVGGKPFFNKEGLTWQLISTSIKARYLPEGYILDSGAPVAILKPNIAKEELFFIIGWLLTKKCNNILKNVINHTKNIQSKDIERLPYPFWVSQNNKDKIVQIVIDSIEYKKNYGNIKEEFSQLEELFSMS